MDDPPTIDIGIQDPDQGQPRRNNPPTQQSGRSKAVGVALVAAAIGLAVVAGVSALRGGNDSAEPVQRTGEIPTVGAGAGADVGGTRLGSAVGPTVEPTPGTVFQPPSARHLRSDHVAARFGETIDSDNAEYGVAYVANGEVTILDRRGISMPEPLVAQSYATVSELDLLTSGGRTWAIDGAVRDRSYLVSNNFIVVGSSRPGILGIIDPDSMVDLELMSAGLPVPSVALPEGVDLLWVQGRGVLMMPRTGGTFEVQGTASSLTRISDARAVAASLSGVVYQACDDTLVCTYLAEVNGAEPVELSFPERTRFSLSPDGESLVAMRADDTSVLLTIGTESERTLAGGRISAIDWAPNSSFVVIVRDDQLEVVYPATGQTVEMTLNDVPDDDSLLVFASQ